MEKIVAYLMAIAFIILGIYSLYKGIKTKNRGVIIKAIITKIRNFNNHHNVYILYTYKNKRYEDIRYPHYLSSMHKGDQIEIKINPNNPEEFYTPFVNIRFGIIFILVGLFILCNLIMNL